jgi:hypothetical protein
MYVDEFPQRLLQPPVAVIVIRARGLRLQPQRFAIRHSAQVSWLWVDHFRLLAFDLTQAEGRVSLQDLMAMEIVESFR